MSSKNRETLAGIYESLGAFLKEFDNPEPEDTDEDQDGDGKTKNDKEEKDVTKQEVETIVSAAIAKAMGGTAPQQEQAVPPAQAAQDGAQAVEKAAVAEGAAPEAVTPEGIEKMVQDAIAKALAPQQEQVSAEQVQEMITAAVAKAVDPVLKSRGLPSNLNGGIVEKQQEQHYLHGIL